MSLVDSTYGNQIPDFYRTMFETNWKEAVQFKRSQLVSTVMNQQYTEQLARINLFEEAQPLNTKAGRIQPTVTNEVNGKFRWLATTDFDQAYILDEFDASKLEPLVSPQSEALRNMGYAFDKKVDQIIMAAITADVKEGKTAGTTVSWDSTHTIAKDYVASGSATNTGLTWDKICRVNQLLKENYVNPGLGDEVYFVISPQDEQDLLQISEVKNSLYTGPYGNNTVTNTGTINGKEFMGFKWVVSPLITATGNVKTCYVYRKDAILFNPGVQMHYVDRRPDRSNAIQLRMACYMGALRQYDRPVFTVQTYHAA